MQVIFHAGVHCTDEDRVLKCLLKNRGDFSPLGVIVPPPGRYRKLLHETLVALGKSDPTPDAREILLDAILDEEHADRVLLSNENLFCVAKLALKGQIFYPKAASRLGQLKSLFQGDDIEIYLSIRNPATFLPALYKKTPHEQFIDMTNGVDPLDLRWSELIYRMRAEHPDIPITVWCNEDTPMIWAQIIREMGGINPNQKIKGAFDLISEIMTREGMKRFRAYLKTHPIMTEMQKRRVISAFLDKFAREDMIEEELDLPGWTDDLVEELSDIYDEDVFEIQRIPGVTFISP